MLDDAFMEKLNRAYEADELPPHPRWCALADQPRGACASARWDGRITDLEHRSVMTSKPEPCFYLVRSDSAGFGIGEVQVGYVLRYEEDYWEPGEARYIGDLLLKVADLAEAAQAATRMAS